MLVRLAAAAVAGGAVGFHFELQDRPGGLRTHTLTTLGAALFCMTIARVDGATASEISRVIQGIASGVGFIGAAAVLRRAGHVHGVSTAASLWIVAAIGCEAGVGSVVIALGVGLGVLTLNVAAYNFEHKFLAKRRAKRREERGD